MSNETPHTTSPRAGSHLPALDGLRGVAVLIVMVLHFTMIEPSGPVESLFKGVVSAGWAGVDLFFVLSGFLITGILCDAKSKHGYFRTFYIRRSLRIFPLYFGFLFLLFVIVPLLMPTHAEPERAVERLMLWGYLGNFAFASVGWEGMPAHTTHLWSLAVEEQFYLIWPLVVWWASRRQLIRICICAIILAWVTRAVLYLIAADGIAGYALLPARMDALAVGGLIAVLYREGKAAALFRAAGPAAIAGCMVVLSVAAYRWSEGLGTTLNALDIRVQLLAYPAFAVVFAALLIRAVSSPPSGVLQTLLTSAPLLAFGRFSYALYLIHVPLRDVLRNRIAGQSGLPRLMGTQLPAQAAVIAGGILLSFVIALASWHLFEKRVLALKERFVYDPAPVEFRSGHGAASDSQPGVILLSTALPPDRDIGVPSVRALSTYSSRKSDTAI